MSGEITRLMDISQRLVALGKRGKVTTEEIRAFLEEIRATIADVRRSCSGPLDEQIKQMGERLEDLAKRMEAAEELRDVDSGPMEQIYAMVSGEAPPPLEAIDRRDSILCRVCGERFRSLRVHLRASHGLTPTEYRARFGAGVPLNCDEVLETRREIGRRVKK